MLSNNLSLDNKRLYHYARPAAKAWWGGKFVPHLGVPENQVWVVDEDGHIRSIITWAQGVMRIIDWPLPKDAFTEEG